ncbi:hypothetical protein WUBG_16222, partial [Wuchereria bancrofti]
MVDILMKYWHQFLQLNIKKVKNDDMTLSKIILPTSEMHTNENPMIYIIRQ